MIHSQIARSFAVASALSFSLCAAHAQSSGVPGDGIPDIYYFPSAGLSVNTSLGSLSRPAGTLTVDTDGSDMVAILIGGNDVSLAPDCELCGATAFLPDPTGFPPLFASNWTVGFISGSTQWIRTNPLIGPGFQGVIGEGDDPFGLFPDLGLANYGPGLDQADFPKIFNGASVLFASDDGSTVLTNVTIVCETPVPANDDCASAIALAPCGVESVAFNTACATASGADATTCPFMDASGPAPDVWYSLTPTTDSLVTLDTCGSSYDTELVIWDACGGSELACDCGFQTMPAGCTGLAADSAIFDFPVTGGTTYLIQLSGFLATDVGAGLLNVNTTPVDAVTNYCTTGVSGAIMSLVGSTSVLANNVTLEAAPVPDTFGLFYFGQGQNNSPFGLGTRCVGPPSVLRVPPPSLPSSPGIQSIPLPLDSFPGSSILPGSCWNFQYWFRLGGSFDLSDGLLVFFGA